MTRSMVHARPRDGARRRFRLQHCDEQAADNAAKGAEAVKEAGDKTIVAGLDQKRPLPGRCQGGGHGRHAGRPRTLYGAVPDDAAFDKLPAGPYDTWLKPESRAELTRTLTYHILPGTVLADDIGKAIDKANGKAPLATMGGGTLTADARGRQDRAHRWRRRQGDHRARPTKLAPTAWSTGSTRC